MLEVRDNASHTVIDAAFRALASRYHPDRNPSAAAERRMVELNRAYALVRTSDLRAVYDRLHPPVNPDPNIAPALRVSMQRAVKAVRELPPEDQGRLMTYIAVRGETMLSQMIGEVVDLMARRDPG